MSWLYQQPTLVFSSRKLPTVRDADLRFVSGEVSNGHQQFVAAAAGKNNWVAGGGALAGQSFDAGLLDELIIQVASVTLGQGSPLFPLRIVFPPLRLTSERAVGEVFVELHYELPGQLQLSSSA